MGVLLVGLGGLAAIMGVATDTAKEVLEVNLATEASRNDTSLQTIRGTNGLVAVSQQPNNLASQAPPRYEDRDTATFPIADKYDMYVLDPWFITAGTTLRPDPANGYDRSLFPCYDDRLDVINHGPHEAIANSLTGLWAPTLPRADFDPLTAANTAHVDPVGPPWVDTWAGGTVPETYPLGRRLVRLLPGTRINAAMEQYNATRATNVSIALDPTRELRDAGLSVLGSATLGNRTTTNIRSPQSFISLVDDTGADLVVTTIVVENRRVAPNPNGSFDSPTAAGGQRQRLDPYPVAADGADDGTDPTQTNYRGERLAYVTYAEAPIVDNKGTFTMTCHRSVDPRVRVGGYLLLLRRNYSFITSAPFRTLGKLDYSFVRIESIESEPELDTVAGVYRATVTVSGKDWLFHPIQSYRPGLQGRGPYVGRFFPAFPAIDYSIPSGVQTNAAGDNLGIYDAGTVSASGSNTGHTGTEGDPLYGTEVVILDNVISVVVQ